MESKSFIFSHLGDKYCICTVLCICMYIFEIIVLVLYQNHIVFTKYFTAKNSNIYKITRKRTVWKNAKHSVEITGIHSRAFLAKIP